MRKDEIKGSFHEVKGKVEETAGQVTNNPDLEVEGKAETHHLHDRLLIRKERSAAPFIDRIVTNQYK